MANINILQNSPVYDKDAQSYRVAMSISLANGIIKQLFVKQRIRNFFKNTFEDVFVAIATPVQLEDFGVDAPREGSSFFLSDSIDLISRNADYLEEITSSVVAQLQKLVDDVNALNNLSVETTYNIS